MLYALAAVLVALLTLAFVADVMIHAWRTVVGGLAVLMAIALLPHIMRALSRMPTIMHHDTQAVLMFGVLPVVMITGLVIWGIASLVKR